jgi:ATP-binding cassette subfamily C protein CydC
MRDLIRLLRLFAPYRNWMWGGIALSTLTIIANFSLMSLSGWFLTACAVAGISSYAVQNKFNFFTPAASVRFFATLRVGSRYAERLVTHDATFRLLAALRVWFYTRLEPLAPAALQNIRAADLLSRIVADIDTLNLFYLRVFTPFIVAVISGLLMVLFFGCFSWTAAGALALGLVLTGLALPLLTQTLGSVSSAEVTTLNAALRAEMVDAIQGMGELLSYNAAPALQARVDALQARLIARQAGLSVLTGFGSAASGLLGNLTLLGVTIAAMTRVAGGTLAVPDLPMLALGAMAAFEAVTPLPLAFQFLGQMRLAAARIFQLADQEPAITPPAAPSPRPVNFDLDLRGVCLRYADGADWALENLDLHIPQGSRVAIMGRTGAGKTSLINLLLRFNEYQSGSVRFGGHDLRDYHGEDMAAYITVVSQRSYLFHTTIRDNLLLAKGDASKDELWHALEVAQLAAFVRAQKLGLDTVVGEAGIRLSGGQARRVALARAVLRDAPWLILDEPTEGLDPITERELLRDLAAVVKGKTVLYITHRSSGLKLMDRVLTMSNGMIIYA